MSPNTWKIGLLGNAGGETAADLRAQIWSAEAAGLDHVAIGDHVSFYVGMGSDGLLRSSALLGMTERMEVNTGVYLLPLRHPVLVARQLADLALLAPGRFTFGVGVGGEDPHEVEICGVDPATRGRRMNECMEIVRALMSGEPIDFAGEFFDLERAHIVPAPVPPIPIVVGGRSDAAIRRAGRLGDGWFGIWVSARRYGEAIEMMQSHASDAGRSDVRWTNALNVWCGVDADPTKARECLARGMEGFYQLPFERFEKWSPYGTPEDVAEFLAPYEQAGCDVVNLIVQAESAEAAVEGAAAVRELLVGAIA